MSVVPQTSEPRPLATIVARLHELSDAIAAIQPPITLEVVTDLILASEARIVNTLREEIQGLRTDVQALGAKVHHQEDLLPMRLFNAKLPTTRPLRYPAGADGAEAIATSAYDLYHLTDPECDDLAQILGLALPPNMTVDQKHTQIAEYLGVVLP